MYFLCVTIAEILSFNDFHTLTSADILTPSRAIGTLPSSWAGRMPSMTLVTIFTFLRHRIIPQRVTRLIYLVLPDLCWPLNPSKTISTLYSYHYRRFKIVPVHLVPYLHGTVILRLFFFAYLPLALTCIYNYIAVLQCSQVDVLCIDSDIVSTIIEGVVSRWLISEYQIIYRSEP